MNKFYLVSIVIPCRNEGKFIGKCLDSVIAQNYPKAKLEVIVVDGMSYDETREIVRDYVQKNTFILLLDNPKKITSAALNIGIRNSRGDLILWMSAHNEYEKEYISKCVRYLESYNADAVGGVIKTFPRKNSLLGRSICAASSHRFGVGYSLHKTGSKNVRWVDTAFGICYKRAVFKKIGTFNENLVRGQDMEFSLRMKKAGFKTLLVPDIVSTYYIRSDFKSFWRHTFKNGVWALLPFKYTEIVPVSWRHLIPLTFVLSLGGSLVLSAFSSIFFWLFCLIIGTYFLANIYFSVIIAISRKDFKYLLIMPLIFTSLHLSYGLGSLSGLINVLISKKFWGNRFKR